MAHDVRAECLCVAEHRPPFLELHLHHVWPQYLGGPDTADNLVWLCPTAHVNVHELLRLLMAYGPLTYGEVDALQDRPVSRFALRLATLGYEQWRTTQP